MQNETPFHRTAMGREFFDSNLPRLIKALEKLNTNIEKLIKQQEPKETKKDEPG